MATGLQQLGKMWSNWLLVCISAMILARYVKSDINLHNPRGSNNRLNENSKARRNANRVFDSQNNNNGGYNVGVNSERGRGWTDSDQYHMTYFMSAPRWERGAKQSFLDIEWTNQHGCGHDTVNCNIVLQYMCQDDEDKAINKKDRKRNGKNTATPQYVYRRKFWNKSWKNRAVLQDNRGYQRALNEPWEWYDKCSRRERNRGLFTADQRLRGKTSKYTRQNPAGTRRGYECPEERDYYPYWHPTDWVDIAVLVNDTKDCAYYQRESFNVKSKGECLEKYGSGWKHFSAYNNVADCNKNNGKWVEFYNHLEILTEYDTKEKCEQYARDKKLVVRWDLPYRSEYIDTFNNDLEKSKKCLVMLDKPDCRKTPTSRPNHLGNGDDVVPLRYKWTLPHYPSGRTQRCVLRIRYNISTNDPSSQIKNNPTEEVPVGNAKLPLRLAINTAQFGRTFQDRSHLFKLKCRESGVIPYNIELHNLNVRGKRGNIVQVYPAVEYDFVPKRMEISESSMIHVQWTGSNSNPNNNAGEGRRGTDRSNFVQMSNPSFSFPLGRTEAEKDMFSNATIVWSCNDQVKTNADLQLYLLSSGYFKKSGQSVSGLNKKLDNASPSFCGVVIKLPPGVYYYMCTRNNNFTNRSQKGRLTVK